MDKGLGLEGWIFESFLFKIPQSAIFVESCLKTNPTGGSSPRDRLISKYVPPIGERKPFPPANGVGESYLP